ncbi:hypothetical protein SO802_035515 [Lithocarpus litseifolius]|uniref:Protein TIC 214 n=1 Tax=Lithocarpus litseifolius TaxID=425828 RepID=A0AAW2BAS0_9ROSI
MIGIADSKLWNLGVGLLSKCNPVSHEDNQIRSLWLVTLLWISDTIFHRALLSLPSPSSGYRRRNREESRVPSPIVTKKLKETSETEERGESEEETDVEIETTSETKGTKQEQEESTEEDPSLSLFSEEKEDPDKIKMDETEEIRMNGKEKTKDEFHFKETRYKNRPIYETSYLDGNQENSKLEIFKEIKDKERFLFEKPLVTILNKLNF